MFAFQEKDSFEGTVLLTALITLAPQNPDRHESQTVYITATFSQKTCVNYGNLTSVPCL
jgi:hypothetical protein